MEKSELKTTTAGFSVPQATMKLLTIVALVFIVAYTRAATPQFLAITCQSLQTMSMFQLDAVSINGTKTKIGNLTHVGMNSFLVYDPVSDYV